MNKQESIKRIKRLDESYLRAEFVLKLIEQLDEPEKATIPQFVADWIETAKTVYSLSGGMTYGGPGVNKCLAIDDNQETFARAWIDGYEIQEKKYVVTDGNHLYFKKYQEDIEIVILVDEQPGAMNYVKKFDAKEEAQKVADILGWEVKEVE